MGRLRGDEASNDKQSYGDEFLGKAHELGVGDAVDRLQREFAAAQPVTAVDGRGEGEVHRRPDPTGGVKKVAHATDLR